MARILRIAAVLLGWIPAGLVLGLLWLNAGEYQGYRPEMGELTAAATGAAVLASLVLGFTCGSRAPATVARVLAVLAAGAALAVAELTANDALYRYVIPLGEQGGRWGTPQVIWSVCAAAAGLGLGLLRRRADLADGPVPGPRRSPRRHLVVAGAVALAGFLAVPEFVRIGAELATSTFVPAGAVAIGSGQRVALPLAAGRHALFASYGGAGCELTDAAGRELSLTHPAVPLTDGNDGAVTELSGRFELPRPGTVTVECTGAPGDIYQIGAPPQVDGPLEALVYGPTAVLLGFGGLPGTLLAAWALARTRRRTTPAQPGPPATVSGRAEH